jgi:hypothetical protein
VTDPHTARKPGKPWFGSKRFGFGVRPQTWQGWAVTTVFLAAVIVIGLLAQH